MLRLLTVACALHHPCAAMGTLYSWDDAASAFTRTWSLFDFWHEEPSLESMEVESMDLEDRLSRRAWIDFWYKKAPKVPSPSPAPTPFGMREPPQEEGDRIASWSPHDPPQDADSYGQAHFETVTYVLPERAFCEPYAREGLREATLHEASRAARAWAARFRTPDGVLDGVLDALVLPIARAEAALERACASLAPGVADAVVLLVDRGEEERSAAR